MVDTDNINACASPSRNQIMQARTQTAKLNVLFDGMHAVAHLFMLSWQEGNIIEKQIMKPSQLNSASIYIYEIIQPHLCQPHGYIRYNINTSLGNCQLL
jgi:hypothetical protein